jgi:hypothetical protein
MIRIEIFRSQNGMICEMKVSGHDESMPHGENIVCAAVSSLTQTALLGLAKHLKRDLDYEVKSGSLWFRLKGAPDDLTSAVLETMLLGLNEIQAISPDGVLIKEHRR